MPTSPVAVKLSPYFSATGEMARLLDEAGADGLVLLNRFLQPDTDPETLTVVRAASLSTAAEVRLPLTWIAQRKAPRPRLLPTLVEAASLPRDLGGERYALGVR